jgi:hypothetical protein
MDAPTTVRTSTDSQGFYLSSMMWSFVVSAGASVFGMPFQTALQTGIVVGVLLAWILGTLHLGTLHVSDTEVVLARRLGTMRMNLEDIRQVTVAPSITSGQREGEGLLSMTLTPTQGRPLRFELQESDADLVLPQVIAPVLRRQRAALAAGEELAFRDPRRFPWSALVRGLIAALGAVFFFGSSMLWARIDFTALIAFGVIGVTGLAGAARAVWTWRRADTDGGLLVSAKGFLPLERAPRRRIDAGAYRTATLGAPFIPWAAIRDVRREGYGLTIETDTTPQRILLTASTEGVTYLEALIQEQRVAADRASFLGPAAAEDADVAEAPVAEAARRNGA